MRMLRRLWAVVRRSRAESEMEREMAAHVAMLEEEFRGKGLSEAEARLAARRAMGGVEITKERHRDERGFAWLDVLGQDARQVWRSLRHSRGFTAVAVVSLALGIGANAGVFTLVDAILLKKLPVADADRVVQLQAKLDQFTTTAFSYPVLRGLANQKEVFRDVVGFSNRQSLMEEEGGEPRKVSLQVVTGNFFPFFAGRAVLGRLLDAEDDRLEGAHAVCVVSEHLWRSEWSGDPGVLGRTVRIDGTALRVVGVVADGFAGAELQQRFDVWVPTSMARSITRNQRESANYIWIGAMGKLRPGTTLARANQQLRAASRAIEASLPSDRANANAVYEAIDGSHGADSWRSNLSSPLTILMGAVAMVLLAACANLSSLLLARLHERRQEFAIKLSLGISRLRLFRQLLGESFAVAFAGGAAAVALAWGLTHVLLELFNSGNRYSAMTIAPDARVPLFVFGAAVVTALLTGSYPAWQATRETGAALKSGPASARRSFLRRGLIFTQVTLAVVLLFGASLFVQSLARLKTVNLGYDIDHVLMVQVQQKSPAPAPATSTQELAEVCDRVRRLPTVEAAAFAMPGALSGGMMATTFADQKKGETGPHQVLVMSVGPEYFKALRQPLLRGRVFAESDRPGSQTVVVVNQALASQAWPGKDPIGRHFRAWNDKDAEVVGVVGNSKYQDVREETMPTAYTAFLQAEDVDGSLTIRCRGGFGPMEREVRQIIKAVAPGHQVSRVSSMEAQRDGLIAQDRFLTFLSSLFGLLGTALAMVGIYGVIAYAVTRRTREIGIRMSVGAGRGDVLGLFLREIVLLLAAGMVCGMAAALKLSLLLEKLLFGVKPGDPAAIAWTLGLLALGGLAAGYFPARKATRVDPVQALRYD